VPRLTEHALCRANNHAEWQLQQPVSLNRAFSDIQVNTRGIPSWVLPYGGTITSDSKCIIQMREIYFNKH
jgi:hypothetical protein